MNMNKCTLSPVQSQKTPQVQGFQSLFNAASDQQKRWATAQNRQSWLYDLNTISHEKLGRLAEPDNDDPGADFRQKSMREAKIFKGYVKGEHRHEGGKQLTNIWTLSLSPEDKKFLDERTFFIWGKALCLHFFLVFQVQALAHRFEYDRTLYNYNDRTLYNYNRDFLCEDGSDFSELSHLKDSIYLSKGPLFENPPKTTI